MYNWITLLDTRKSYNTVNKLYFNKKGKMYNITMYILYIYIYIYIYAHTYIYLQDFPGSTNGKESVYSAGDQV